MSDEKILNKLIKERSREAAIKHQQELNTNSAESILTDVFGNKSKYLNTDIVFEPNFYQCTLKEKFYNNGGNPQASYLTKDYVKFLGITEEEFYSIVKLQPEFLLWLHEKREISDEIDMLVTIASRKLINKMRVASIEEQAKALNTLSKFSTVVNPDKVIKDKSFDAELSELRTPEQIKEAFKNMGIDVISDLEE